MESIMAMLDAVHNYPVARTLIADDQPDVLEALRLLLKAEGFQTEVVTTPGDALEAIRAESFDLLLMDLNYARDTTSGEEGMDLLTNVRALDSTLPVVVMTGWGSVELAIEAMKRGVSDFVLKPWENTQLVSRLKRQIDMGRSARRERRLSAQHQLELKEALAIQQRLLPRVMPQIPGFEIAALWRPARVIGGDYYDVIKVGDDKLAVCIADVSGKGMPAALLMSNLQAAVRAIVCDTVEPGRFCEKLNRAVSANMENDHFISLFYCVLDARRGRLAYANAGHNPPIIMNRKGSVTRLTTGGLVLGPFAEGSYSQEEVEFARTDSLVMFTDGITEAAGSGEEEFGEARLIGLMSENRGVSPADLNETIMTAVSQFCGGPSQDDATVISIGAERIASRA
jgi:sigma-B regulation protein RsbU (phosphoserine phosphatase)